MPDTTFLSQVLISLGLIFVSAAALVVTGGGLIYWAMHNLGRDLREEIRLLREQMREDNQELREDMRQGDQTLREDMQQQNQLLREDMRQGDQTLREEMQQQNQLLREESRLLREVVREEMQQQNHTLREEMNAGFRRLENVIMSHRHDDDGFPMIPFRPTDDD